MTNTITNGLDGFSRVASSGAIAMVTAAAFLLAFSFWILLMVVAKKWWKGFRLYSHHPIAKRIRAYNRRRAAA